MRYEKFDVSFVCGFVGKFVEKLVIGKSVDFLVILYLYRKKVVWIVGWGFGVMWVKMLILVGVDDIGCDIGVW